MAKAIRDELTRLMGSEEHFLNLINSRNDIVDASLPQRLAELNDEERVYADEKENPGRAVAAFGDNDVIRDLLDKLSERGATLAFRRKELARISQRQVELPVSVNDLLARFEEMQNAMGADSFGFSDLLRKLVPEFHVYFVRLCDGGNLLPRARVKLALDRLFCDMQYVVGMPELLTSEVTIDLFVPPERERIREVAAQLAREGHGSKEISRKIAELGDESPSGTAVYNSLKLTRKMNDLQLSSPYVFIHEPLEDNPKLRRHKNARYCFTIRDGYVPPAI